MTAEGGADDGFSLPMIPILIPTQALLKKHRPFVGLVLFIFISNHYEKPEKSVHTDRFHGETIRSIEGRFLQAFISRLRMISS
jgi:hypothetical protein